MVKGMLLGVLKAVYLLIMWRKKIASTIINSEFKFSFKCHRANNGKDATVVNDLSFHPTFGTLATCAGDGGVHIWDKDAKRSCKAYPIQPNDLPVTACSFNRNGTLLAFAHGYDWAKGHQNATSGCTLKVRVVNEEDVQKRNKTK